MNWNVTPDEGGGDMFAVPPADFNSWRHSSFFEKTPALLLVQSAMREIQPVYKNRFDIPQTRSLGTDPLNQLDLSACGSS